MDIHKIVDIEPRLSKVFAVASRNVDVPWANKIKTWVKTIKPEIIKLVGFNAETANLRTPEAYDMVCSHCVGLMGI